MIGESGVTEKPWFLEDFVHIAPRSKIFGERRGYLFVVEKLDAPNSSWEYPREHSGESLH